MPESAPRRIEWRARDVDAALGRSRAIGWIALTLATLGARLYAYPSQRGILFLFLSFLHVWVAGFFIARLFVPRIYKVTEAGPSTRERETAVLPWSAIRRARWGCATVAFDIVGRWRRLLLVLPADPDVRERVLALLRSRLPGDGL